MRTFLFVFLFSINLYSQNVHCVISTDLGEIKIELYKAKAPKTVANFLRYVENDLYKNTSFFRVCTAENEADRDVKIQVIQGGDVLEEKCFAPIEIETTAQTGIKHLDGVISMARAEPNSATSSFFICIDDQPELDFKGKRNPDGYGFAAFGRVYDGMNIVRKIQGGDNENQILKKKNKINYIKIIEDEIEIDPDC